VATTTLGSYELGEVLGRGAMGEVHRAARNGSDDQIAVKVLRPELAADPELIARFLQERSILCSLEHPNLVRVHDLVVEGGSAAIVMDLVEGSNLRQVLNEAGTLAPAEAARLIGELLLALGAVHAIGIVHRDVKPENVLIGSDGELRLTDFGIARLARGPSLTRMSGLIGTPEYLAPELAEREHATPAADVYAVGILFYELLSGFTPFCGGHPVAVLRRHIEEAPPRLAGIPDDLWDLLASMLAKEPTTRPSVAEAHQRLVSLAPKLDGLPALPPTRPERESEESPTSMKLRALDPQEQATVIKSKKSKQTAEDSTKGRRIAVVALVVVVLAGALVGVVLSLPKSPAPHPPATYSFGPQVYSGLIANRTWTLSGKTGNHLHGKVVLTNGTTKDLPTTYDEVIPPQVAKTVGRVTFTPTPDKIVQQDPVVQYEVNLASGASTTISYAANVTKTTGSWSAHLKKLASDQTTAQAAFLHSTDQPAPVTLATLTVDPNSLSLTVGGTATIALSGTMSDNTLAPTAALNGVNWSSADQSVAGVTDGIVYAVGAGSTTITAQAGSIAKSVAVTVAAPAGQSSVGTTTTSGGGSKSSGGSSTTPTIKTKDTSTTSTSTTSTSTTSTTTTTTTNATPIPTTTEISVNPTSTSIGDSVIYSAIVSTSSGGSDPKGSVTFTSGSVLLCTTANLKDGNSSCTSTSAPTGIDTITGTYNGGSDFGGSSGTTGLDVVQPASPTSTTASVNPTSTIVNSSVTYSASVSVASGGTDPTGTVTFTSGSIKLCTTASLVDGNGSCTSMSAPAGNDTITGTYEGSSDFGGSSGTTGLDVVQPIPTTTTASVNPTTVQFGLSVTYSATVTPEAEGTVTFTSGAIMLCAATLINGVASCTSTLAPGDGPNTITATYGGNEPYTGSAGTTPLFVFQLSPGPCLVATCTYATDTSVRTMVDR